MVYAPESTADEARVCKGGVGAEKARGDLSPVSQDVEAKSGAEKQLEFFLKYSRCYPREGGLSGFVQKLRMLAFLERAKVKIHARYSVDLPIGQCKRPV